MIHYHGGPVTPLDAAVRLWTARHACVSFENAGQVALAFEVCQSVMLDNGAYTVWTQGRGTVDVEAYAAWVMEWESHPSFDFALIPDSIDGDEAANDLLIATWFKQHTKTMGVPVWHMHESLDRLRRLCHSYPRVALGSSGEWATVGNAAWWVRMAAAMDAICDEQGRPPCKLHGLRMLNPAVFCDLPLASADSTNVARNIGIDKSWRGPYRPVTDAMRAAVLAERIEATGAASHWDGAKRHHQHSLELSLA